METFDMIHNNHIYKNVAANIALMLKQRSNLPYDICLLMEEYSMYTYASIHTCKDYSGYLVYIKNNIIKIYEVPSSNQMQIFDYFIDRWMYEEIKKKKLLKSYKIEKIFMDTYTKEYPHIVDCSDSLIKVGNKKYLYISPNYICEFKTEDEIIGRYRMKKETWINFSLGETNIYHIYHGIYGKRPVFGRDTDNVIINSHNLSEAYKLKRKMDITKIHMAKGGHASYTIPDSFLTSFL